MFGLEVLVWGQSDSCPCLGGTSPYLYDCTPEVEGNDSCVACDTPCHGGNESSNSETHGCCGAVEFVRATHCCENNVLITHHAHHGSYIPPSAPQTAYYDGAHAESESCIFWGWDIVDGVHQVHRWRIELSDISIVQSKIVFPGNWGEPFQTAHSQGCGTGTPPTSSVPVDPLPSITAGDIGTSFEIAAAIPNPASPHFAVAAIVLGLVPSADVLTASIPQQAAVPNRHLSIGNYKRTGYVDSGELSSETPLFLQRFGHRFGNPDPYAPGTMVGPEVEDRKLDLSGVKVTYSKDANIKIAVSLGQLNTQVECCPNL
jgi:hypothetical protein